MPKSRAQAAGLPLSRSVLDHSVYDGHPDWAAWQAHVDAGRIGSRTNGRPQLSVEGRVRMMRQEIALFGRVMTRELEEF